MQEKRYRYNEGQWFAVPLRSEGFALGIIVRGSSRTKGGLGYFFGPKHLEIPDEKETWKVNQQNAILVSWFSDWGIKIGRWPLIKSTRPFSKEDWPIPKFSQPITFPPDKAYIIEYDQNDTGEMNPRKITVINASEIVGLPVARLSGGGAIEIRLTDILEGRSTD
jgi:hypothetical protein